MMLRNVIRSKKFTMGCKERIPIDPRATGEKKFLYRMVDADVMVDEMTGQQ